MSEVTPTSERKADHIRVNLEEDVASGLRNGLQRFRFRHNALPELDLAQVSTETIFLNRPLKAPILISGMTGGTDEAGKINRALAQAAQAGGVAMGLGSQRAALEDDSVADSFRVRSVAPDVLLFGNLGAVQFNYGYTVDHCRRAVEMIEADALVLHLNAVQEALQPEGDSNFSQLLPKIEAVCKQLSVPVIAKEVGWGINGDVAEQLVNVGVSAIDVAGAGGTSWSQVEMYRAQNPQQAQLAASFINWGIPTADCVLEIRGRLPDVPIIASGGLRSGLDIAMCLALGADLGGMASPFLKAAAQSTEAVLAAIELARDQIRIAAFSTGAADLDQLRQDRLEVISASG